MSLYRVALVSIRYIQADTAGSVPDYGCDNAIKQVTHILWFPSAYKSYVYVILWSIKCAIALCLKKQCVHLNSKILYC